MTDDWSYLAPVVCSSCSVVSSFHPAAGACHVPGIYLALSQSCLAVLQPSSSSPGGTRICHFCFLPFQCGSWSNNCENGTKRREIIWPEAGGGQSLLPVRDSSVVLLDQLSLGPQALLLFRGIYKWTKGILPSQIIGSITAQYCSQGFQSEEIFGFLIFLAFCRTHLSFNLISGLPQNPPLLKSLRKSFVCLTTTVHYYTLI